MSTLASLEHHLMAGFWDTYGDPRVRHLPFMSSFRIPAAILTAYLLFIFIIGPRWMRHRPAYSLKPLLLAYNTFLAAYNGYVFLAFLLDFRRTWEMILDTKFPPFSPVRSGHILFNYLYMISKFIDLLDTVFFVLRHKTANITGLHLYHHFSVALFSWITVRLCAICKPAIPFAVINAFIHLLMYSYFALSALGPAVRPYLWWKRYLTQLQILQFIPLFIHAVYFITTQEGYSLFYTANAIANPIVYFVLYTRFYYKRYSDSKKLKDETDKDVMTAANGLKCKDL